MSAMTLQTLSHLLPTLHLLKYTHGAIMRLQGQNSSSSSAEEPLSSTQPLSPHALATQWWADEAKEGLAIRTNKEVLHLLKENGLTLGDTSNEGEIPEVPEGQLLFSAKMAVKMLREQGSRPSDHWMYANS